MVLLQYRVPENDYPITYPYHYSTWGGKWQGNNPLEEAERELSEELLPSLVKAVVGKLEQQGIYLMPLPTSMAEAEKAGVSNLVNEGFTHWLNWMFSARIASLNEFFRNCMQGGLGYKVPEGFAQIHSINTLPPEKDFMSDYKKVVRHIVLGEEQKIIFGKSVADLEVKIV
ncbi:hypothetical protein D6745_00855 [Candidatus Woesearchaeota archaeon]|nr:MAG: hypothetical protein D6745_00855 [Candidatus Woesearchaeota archaeon]